MTKGDRTDHERREADAIRNSGLMSLPSHPISLGSFRSFSLRSLPLLSPLDLGCECKVREVTSETRERETEGKRPAVRPLAHASLAPSGRNEWSREAAVSDMSRRPTDPPIPPPTPWLAPRHLPPPSVTPVRHSLVLRLAHSDVSCRRRRTIER